MNVPTYVLEYLLGKDHEDEYLLDNIFDIKYYIHTNEMGKNEFRYFVGTKRNALQTSVHNACAVRKVVSGNGDIEFETLLPLMAVDFVRNNKYTVLPFPFKFLRKYYMMIMLSLFCPLF